MKLFLTSKAAKTLDKITEYLDKDPKDLKVAFIPTAADLAKSKPWVLADRDKLVELDFNVLDIDLKEKNEIELRKLLEGTDIIFVTGGNTFYLLEKSVKSGFDKVVKELVKNGVIYIGSSAGSVIAGPDIEAVQDFDDPSQSDLDSTAGFSLVDFVILPHYKQEKYGSMHDTAIEEFGDRYNLIPLTDKQFILVEDSNYKII